MPLINPQYWKKRKIIIASLTVYTIKWFKLIMHALWSLIQYMQRTLSIFLREFSLLIQTCEHVEISKDSNS